MTAKVQLKGQAGLMGGVRSNSSCLVFALLLEFSDGGFRPTAEKDDG